MNKKIRKIINALGIHEDTDSISVLEELGTNSPDYEIRELTSRVLVRKNIPDSLKIIITNQGKGINDLNPIISIGTINEILALDDKTEVIKVLDDTINMHSDKDVRDSAQSVKSLILLSK